MDQSVIESGSVQIEKNNGIAYVEFFHPMSNSLPGKLLSKLADSISNLGADSEVNVIVLKDLSLFEREF